MKKILPLLLIAACPLWAKEKAMTEDQKISHAIGRQVGQGMKSQGIVLDLPSFMEAVKSAYQGNPDTLTPEETQAAFQSMQEKAKKKQSAQGDENRKKGDAFLSANKSKPGVKTTASGLQYRVEKEGNGNPPKETSTVRVHYKGTLLDGTEFDSSYKRNQPAEFPLNGVIKGWTEGLQLMKPGAKYTFFIPSDMAYGPSGRPSIPPNSVLIFEVELLEILK